MREFRFLYALALVVIVAASLSACVQKQAAVAADNIPAFSAPNSLSGGYLAGRFAQRQQDWATAQDYMSSVLSYDGANGEMVLRTFLLALGSGHYDRARELASKIIDSDEADELALIYMACDSIRAGDYKLALGYLDQLPAEGFGQYTKPLLSVWALAGEGKKDDAMKVLTDNSAPTDPAFRIHAGMLEEMAGNMNAAEGQYRQAMGNGLMLHTAIMVGNFYERYGRPEITQGIYEGLDKAYPFSPFMNSLNSRDTHRVIAPNVASPADGAALAMFDVATILFEKRAYDSAQIYGSIVRMLSPDMPYVRLMMGDLATLRKQYDKAVAEYSAVTEESPLYWFAHLRMTEAYESSGQDAMAIQMLQNMAQDPAIRQQALVSLGDIYRRQEDFEKAVNAYSEALDGVKEIKSEHWPIVYARGMAEERLNRWDRAEKDLLQALSFQPDNPMVLNYIAYSWANQGIHLEKALEYARYAATLKPEDGYILDSYGWALFRMKKYDQAVNVLEQAVERIPNDSTLLDHLGDAYWQVGRYNEARYRWRHAMDMSKDPGFKSVAEQKLLHGITVPHMVARNGEGI